MKKKRVKTHVEQALERLGLGENEATLYSLLLEHPKSTVQELQQKSPFPRTLLYHILNKLTGDGLVSQKKDHWRTTYRAEDPERLLDLLSKRENEFIKLKEDVKEMIPGMRQTYRLHESRPGIRTLEGLDQYWVALEDIFNAGADSLYIYAPSKTKTIQPGIEARKKAHKAYMNKGIAVRILTEDQQTAKHCRSAYGKNPFFDLKFLSGDTAVKPVDMRLYSGKILYTKFDKREPIVTIIEDSGLYEMQKNIFYQLWQTATPYL